MPHLPRTARPIFLIGGLLLIVVAIPVGLMWQQIRQEQQSRALYQAVEQGNTQRVRTLLNAGASPNVRENPAMPPHGVRAWLQWMLHHAPNKASGSSALMTASYKGQEETVRLLIKAGADVHAVEKEDNGSVDTALSFAIYSQEPATKRIIGLLIEAGANPDQADSLLRAVNDKDAEIVNLLLSHRANFDSDAEETRILAFYATYNLDAGVMKALLDKGVRIDIPVQEGSLLISASQTGNVNVVKLLVSRGAALNFKDANGTTALRWAEIERRRDLAKGATKQEVAGYDTIIAFLKAYGGRDD